MNILFLTIGDFKDVRQGGIYPDLMYALQRRGHRIHVVCAGERRNGEPTGLTETDGMQILRVRTGNITKTNIVEKGISTLRIEGQFKGAIRKYFSGVRFDLVLYSTPPITFCGVIAYVKKRDGAKSYLLLKDIFPQNAVDMGMMQKTGPKALLYRYFRAREKKLYALSDRIGCMSPANVEYLLKHNPQVDPAKVEICPNAIAVQDLSVCAQERKALRQKYSIPTDKKVFVYGGNLGKPQGIPFILDCLQQQKENPKSYFLIVGDGTEYGKLHSWFVTEQPGNMQLLKRLPKEDYDRLVAACDVGLIFLDHRFTIPNFPSRLLAYMQAGIPVLACTDPNTDIGQVITEGGFGWWCESNDPAAFAERAAQALQADLQIMGQRGFEYLQTHYTADGAAETILCALGAE